MQALLSKLNCSVVINFIKPANVLLQLVVAVCGVIAGNLIKTIIIT